MSVVPGIRIDAAWASISAITVNGTMGRPSRLGSSAEIRRPPSVWCAATGSVAASRLRNETSDRPATSSRISPTHGPAARLPGTSAEIIA